MGCEASQAKRPALEEQAKEILTVTEPELVSEAPAMSPAAPVAALEPEPTLRSYFEGVLDIKVEIDPDTWDELRWQVRTWDSIFLPSGEHRLDGPAESPYTWFKADVTVDGHVYPDTGIRKKGRAGSQDDDKPSLKLRFDKFVDDQSLPGGLERLTLNNSKQDRSMVGTCLAYFIYEHAGLVAPRCHYAKVSVNGDYLGLYVNVEQVEHYTIPRTFEDDDGNLYEGEISDFTPKYRNTFEKETNSSEDDWSDIDAAVAALENGDDRELAEVFDLGQFLDFWAVEVLIGSKDGYSGNRNNFFVYREQGGRFVFIPWGQDDVFATTDRHDDDFESPQSVMAAGALANFLYHRDGWRELYVATLEDFRDELWDEKKLADKAVELMAFVQEHATAYERVIAEHDLPRVMLWIANRTDQINRELVDGPPEWPGGSKHT